MGERETESDLMILNKHTKENQLSQSLNVLRMRFKALSEECKRR